MTDRQVTFAEVITDLTRTLNRIAVRLDDIGAEVIGQFDKQAKEIVELKAKLTSAVEQIPSEE